MTSFPAEIPPVHGRGYGDRGQLSRRWRVHVCMRVRPPAIASSFHPHSVIYGRVSAIDHRPAPQCLGSNWHVYSRAISRVQSVMKPCLAVHMAGLRPSNTSWQIFHNALWASNEEEKIPRGVGCTCYRVEPWVGTGIDIHLLTVGMTDVMADTVAYFMKTIIISSSRDFTPLSITVDQGWGQFYIQLEALLHEREHWVSVSLLAHSLLQVAYHHCHLEHRQMK